MTTQLVPDSEYTGIMKLLPAKLRGFALLARFDRPIGWWLLFWPCVFGLALSGGLIARWDLALWMLLGAVAMRGAGCVYNDIIDRDLDAQVARTAHRPLASGLISRKAAWAWLLMLALVGLTVLLPLNLNAQLLALGSLLLVAAYPFMKRITWIKSSALRLGGSVRAGVAIFYLLALSGWGMAIWSVRPEQQALVALVPAAFHLVMQVASLQADGSNALGHFRSNRVTGLLAALAFLVVGAAGQY